MSDFPVAVLDLEDMKFSATAWLFEGGQHGDVAVSMFVVRSPVDASVEMHTHPYRETFLLLEGSGRWTVDSEILELEARQILTVPPNTPHGFRNTGQEPLLLVSVHEAPMLNQTFLGRQPQ